MKIFTATGQRMRLSFVLFTLLSAAALVERYPIAQRLRQLVEGETPSAADLRELVDQGNAAVAEVDQLEKNSRREYPLTDDLPKVLSKPANFSLYHKTSDIPQVVGSAFAKASGEQSFSMADPGGQWEPGDVIRDARLPHRRLAAAAIGAGLWLLFYEHGGFGRSDDVAVFKVTDGQAQAIWHAYVSDTVVDAAELAKAIQEKDYRESPFF